MMTAIIMISWYDSLSACEDRIRITGPT